ncbi:MAG: GGDEF domain-containing protein [Bacilli bacterium]|nr:GGDEF domain-containing protein [Bacilli bacterium]
MAKKVRLIFILFVGIIIVAVASLVVVNILNDENKLTVEENKWINNNLSTVLNVNVINDLDIFGKSGAGVFYDFLNDLGKEYNLKINPITYTSKDENITSGFIATNTKNDKFVEFYADNYVLLKKDYVYYNNIEAIKDIKIGVLKSDADYIKGYFNEDKNIEFKSFDTYDALKESFNKDLDYIMVPKYELTSDILEKNYSVVYEFSDIKKYYGYYMLDDNFSSVIKKYYNRWHNKKYKNAFNTNLKNTLVKSIKLSEVEQKELTSRIYNYGFVNNNPYEIILGGNYGGIVSVYLKNFSEMAGVDFKYIKYRTYKQLTNAINNNSVDLYFNYYNLTNNYQTITTNMDIKYYVIASRKNDIVVNSLNSLQNQTVYVMQDSIIYENLKNINGIDLKTYKKVSDLKKLAKSGAIAVVDYDTYLDVASTTLKDYSPRYANSLNIPYTFKVREDNAFTKLFKAYISLSDASMIRVEGLNSYKKTLDSGTILGTIAKYILYFLIIFVILIYALYKRARKIKISKKIKKEEKIRYIDQLTSLKNRNYLMENASSWNKNTIYPQAMVVVDLNRIQEINDTLGYEKGDAQIKAAANILIRTQLDNSDIVRTDGTEFLIYLVGYDERQVVSYIKKLTKELKNMPYDFGASIGHSMIDSDKKLVEDALNEAVEDMKIKKQENSLKE